MLGELRDGYATLEEHMEQARLETLLTGEYDANNALVSFQARAVKLDGGAGLVPDALPDVHPLGGAARLYL